MCESPLTAECVLPVSCLPLYPQSMQARTQEITSFVSKAVEGMDITSELGLPLSPAAVRHGTSVHM
jgi:hypothetical protein